MQKSVAIIGAGLAGLTCAAELQKSQTTFDIFEASDRIGGKLKTDYVDGFILDHGFQVHFTSYPFAAKHIDNDALNGKPFGNGSLIFWNGKLNLIAKDQPIVTALSPLFSLKDKLKTLMMTEAIDSQSDDNLKAKSEPKSAFGALTALKFSENYINRFARPFFGGIFLDRSLETCETQFQWIWKMLGKGNTVLPAEGIAALPASIAREIPTEDIHLNQPVSGIKRVKNGLMLTTEKGESGPYQSVVIAANAKVIRDLVGIPVDTETLSSTCFYFRSPIPPVTQPYLILNGSNTGIVNHVAPLSVVQRTYAPIGEHLTSVNILGTPSGTNEEVAERIITELATWFPDRRVDEWKLLEAYEIKDAQLSQRPGFRDRNPDPVTKIKGVFLAGETTTSSSIDGAIESGEIAAKLVDDFIRSN
jgi:protoporphyrinogen oxidase